MTTRNTSKVKKVVQNILMALKFNNDGWRNNAGISKKTQREFKV